MNGEVIKDSDNITVIMANILGAFDDEAKISINDTKRRGK
jgi:hypothetical protein